MIRKMLFHLLSDQTTGHEDDDVSQEVRNIISEARQIGREVFGREPEEVTVRYIATLLHQTRGHQKVGEFLDQTEKRIDQEGKRAIFEDVSKN